MTTNKVKEFGWNVLAASASGMTVGFAFAVLLTPVTALASGDAGWMTLVIMVGNLVGSWLAAKVCSWASKKSDAASELVWADEDAAEAKASAVLDRAMLLNEVQYAIKQLKKFGCIDRAVDALERAEDRLGGQATWDELAEIEARRDAGQGGE